MARERAIGRFTFPTRKAAEEKIRSILYATPTDVPLAGDDLELIEALLRLHHEAAEKIGPGVASIVARRSEYRTRCFWVVRTDGTSIDFSFRTALDGAKTHRENVVSAMRFAVRDQINLFRSEWFAYHAGADGSVICPLSGRKVFSGPDAHVDHVIPFADLVEDYITKCGGIAVIKYQQSAEHMSSELVGLDRVAWPMWHRQYAQLRVVHKDANLARGRRRDVA